MTKIKNEITKSNKNTHQISLKESYKNFYNLDSETNKMAMVIADSGWLKIPAKSWSESAEDNMQPLWAEVRFNVPFPKGTVKEKDLKNLSYIIEVKEANGLVPVGAIEWQDYKWDTQPDYIEVFKADTKRYAGSYQNDLTEGIISYGGHGYYLDSDPYNINYGAVSTENESIEYSGHEVGYEGIDVSWNASLNKWVLSAGTIRTGSEFGNTGTYKYIMNITSVSSLNIVGYGYEMVRVGTPWPRSLTNPSTMFGSWGDVSNTYLAQLAFWESYFPYSVHNRNFTYEYTTSWESLIIDEFSDKTLSSPIPYYDEIYAIQTNGTSLTNIGTWNHFINHYLSDTLLDPTGKTAQEHYDDTVVLKEFPYPVTLHNNNYELETEKSGAKSIAHGEQSCFYLKKDSVDEYEMVIDYGMIFQSANSTMREVDRDYNAKEYTGVDDPHLIPQEIPPLKYYRASDNEVELRCKVIYDSSMDLKTLEPYA